MSHTYLSSCLFKVQFRSAPCYSRLDRYITVAAGVGLTISGGVSMWKRLVLFCWVGDGELTLSQVCCMQCCVSCVCAACTLYV